LGDLTKLIGSAGLSIKQIEILHAREGEKGAIRMGFATKEEQEQAFYFLRYGGFPFSYRKGWIDLLEVQKVSKLQGTIKVAGDKSISHRAIMLSSISQGVSTIKGFLQGDDCNNTIACFRRLGVEIENKTMKLSFMVEACMVFKNLIVP